MTENIDDTEAIIADPNTLLVDFGVESSSKSTTTVEPSPFESSEDESAVPISKTKKRVKTFSDSDNDVPTLEEPEGSKIRNPSISDTEDSNIVVKSRSRTSRKAAISGDEDSDDEGKQDTKALDSEGSINDLKSNKHNKKYKSRIRQVVSADDDSDSKELVATKNEEQQQRMKNKKNKLKNKFKGLIKSRENDAGMQTKETGDESFKESSGNESDSSNDEISSINKIKQKIKERSSSIKMSICDPDTSDEESEKKIKVNKPKNDQKRTKMISPKPQRMSAKEAMENMQKIKSESNRMLREREVSLPYHRPKALSLQDIMKRRRPAVSSDGKALPIKMNDEQLKQYALLLEQRQKEMMELCKSESEEEDDGKNNVEDSQPPVNSVDVAQKESIDVSDHTELSNGSTAQIRLEVNEGGKLLHETSTSTALSNKDDHGAQSMDVETAIEGETNGDDNIPNKSGDMSTEMELVYNDSIEDANTSDDNPKIQSCDTNNKDDIDKDLAALDSSNADFPNKNNEDVENLKNLKEIHQANIANHISEKDSQLIALHYDSELSEPIEAKLKEQNIVSNDITHEKSAENEKNYSDEDLGTDEFPDDDDDMDMDNINMDDINSIIENAEIAKDTVNPSTMDSPALIRDIPVLNVKPKLAGAPGMVIDLDGSDPVAPKKLTGVELLKERFTFFAKLKTPEEMEREREKRQKPGTQHLKLKQELEDIIAEQRSLEWSKRLEGEKQEQMELNALRGDEEDSDVEDDIDKIEAKLEENEMEKESSSESEADNDLLEDDVLIEDKPKKKNPLVEDEAEESDVEETEKNCEEDDNVNEAVNDDVQGDDDISEEESSDEEESSESEEESEAKPKKGRILKAFEDSDDECDSMVNEKGDNPANNANEPKKSGNIVEDNLSQSQSYGIMDSQDDVIQLAQVEKQVSSDVFPSQGSVNNNSQDNRTTLDNSKDDEDLGTQTFSIMNNTTIVKNTDDPDKLTVVSDDSDKLNVVSSDLDKIISETQPFNEDNLDAVVGMCSGSFQTQNCIEIEPPSMKTQMSQSQVIGEDLLDMCTGKFYDNQFVSPSDNNIMNMSDDFSQEQISIEKPQESAPKNEVKDNEKQFQDGNILKSVLDELSEPDFESAKPLKFFFDGKFQNKENEPNVSNIVVKKRFVIESDDETNDNSEINEKKKKKPKKRKLEKRALQISDDEEDYDEDQEEDEYISENENDNENDDEGERLVEYDSEENEVEVKPQPMKKKKRKATEFFEQEAELTSEDEWVGSGDEDEAGLDRMEREEGDDETFHQGKLQRELGQIHMRDVLDQDKREVRLIQELLFEDGDLGGGGRQRKFRWRNADSEEVSGTIPDELADTQEEEFESEEQWRKQRHEREMFLRQMKNEDNEDELNISVNRTSIIKANLCSRTMSSLLEEANQSKTDAPKSAVTEKKTAKDIPSPVKKPFTMFQQNYHGSLLTRGQGALARLAALATPLAADDDAPKIGLLAPSSKRNFVFAALSQEEPKVTKRKAEGNAGTPRLVKKMKTEEKQNRPKSSLLDFLKT